MSNNCDIGLPRLKRIRDLVFEVMKEVGWDEMAKSTQAAALALAIDTGLD